MVASEPVTTAKLNPRKRERIGGRPVKITPDIVSKVAENLATGLSLRMALRLAHPEISTVHWARSLERDTRIAAAFEVKEAEVVKRLLDELYQRSLGGTKAQWTAIAWILERRWRDDYGQKPSGSGTNVNVQVNTLVGLGEDVLRRASTFIKRSERTLRISNSTEKVIAEGKP
jgi:hypothetical protein